MIVERKMMHNDNGVIKVINQHIHEDLELLGWDGTAECLAVRQQRANQHEDDAVEDLYTELGGEGGTA